MNKSIAFLVISCDNYSDLWKPYAELLNRHWSDCPFTKYFATNKIAFNEYGFKSILIGEDISWSVGLKKALVELNKEYEYVLITFEDLFLVDQVDTKFIFKSINEFIRINGNYLRLYTKRKPHLYLNEYFGIIREKTPYRHNCVYSVWRIKNLLSLIVPEENAWEFEKLGTRRSETMDGFYCSTKNCFAISNTLVKGKWVPKELELVKKQIPNFVPERYILSNRDSKKLYIQEFYFNIFLKYVPTVLQMPLLRLFNK